jgi:predicted kinase
MDDINIFMKFKTLYESLNNIEALQKVISSGTSPVYVATAGIQGSGKSTFAKENFKTIDILDLDEINKDISNGDMEAFQRNRSKAISKKNEMLRDLFKKRKSFIDAGTAANTQSLLKKLAHAKSLGYTTAVVYVNIPIKVAIERNLKRIESGSHGVPLERTQEVINRTDMNVRQTIREIKDNPDLVDFFIEKGL